MSINQEYDWIGVEVTPTKGKRWECNVIDNPKDFVEPTAFNDHVKGFTGNEMLALVFAAEHYLDTDAAPEPYRGDVETALKKLKGELQEMGVNMTEPHAGVENAWLNFVRVAKQELTPSKWRMISAIIKEVGAMLDFAEPVQTTLDPMVMEPSSYCPDIPEAAEMMQRTEKYLKENPHVEDWNIQADSAEVASIGHDYTFHTHPRGSAQPSEADIKTTKSLKKDYLCIGLVPTGEIVCYDMRDMSVSCEHEV